jgi:23S rRNA pseudouridine1911/1915/1917 synthase
LTQRPKRFVIDEGNADLRLDAAVSGCLEDLSRARAKRWIDEGRVLIEGKRARPSRPCRMGEVIEVSVPPPEPAAPASEAIPLEIVFEDKSLVVVNKSAGMVVHPGPGHSTGTLVNALLAHSKDLSGIGGVLRPGIVHRLDAGTSGLIVVAKHDRAHQSLSAQFQARTVEKRYLAVVLGSPPERFVVDSPIGRDPRERKKISSRSRRPREATSEIHRLESLPLSALVEIRIRTGRTHQIRVHLSEAGYALAGDRDYGAPRRNARVPSRNGAAFRTLRDFSRPALHSSVLAVRHPETGALMRWQAPLPEDMAALVDTLRSLVPRARPTESCAN